MDGGGFKKNPRTNIITPAKTKIWEKGRPANHHKKTKHEYKPSREE
jgi:hypothetical protein